MSLQQNHSMNCDKIPKIVIDTIHNVNRVRDQFFTSYYDSSYHDSANWHTDMRF